MEEHNTHLARPFVTGVYFGLGLIVAQLLFTVIVAAAVFVGMVWMGL